MASTTSFGDSNFGLQAAVINGNVTAQFLQSESLNQACLRDLRTTNPHHDKDRIQNTNGGLLKESYCWILHNEEFQEWQNDQSNCLLWIRGDPGKGKTMLLCGIIEEFTRTIGHTSNIVFFFCQATDERINNATAVLRGLIYSLVLKQPSLLSHLQSHYDQAGKSLFEDINAWSALSKIFMEIVRDPILRSTYLIIDALDECTTDLSYLLELITQAPSAYPQLKWIVSSRNWPDIEERFDTTQAAPISLELNEASVSEAVSKFIQHKVNKLAKVKKYNDETRHTIYHYLSSNSQGTFLWVALVCQELDRTSRRHALERLMTFPPGLNALYGRMMDQVRNSEDAKICKRILAVMSTVYRPITFHELASLVELPDNLPDDFASVSDIIAICGSFLTVREDTIIFVHQSAKDFLLREARDWCLSGGIEAEHFRIFSRSLQAMFKILRRDIFQLKFPGFSIENIMPPLPESISSGRILMSLLEKDWSSCLQILEGHRGTIFSVAWSQDERRLASASYDNTVKIWDPTLGQCVSTLEGHSDSVNSIAWSQDGSRLASASNDNTVRIWDLDTFQCVSILEGHSNSVNSIAWLRNGSRLVSASSDKTVRIWDTATGHCATTFKAPTESHSSIQWSQDISRLGSASNDNAISIWDSVTGKWASALDKHSDLITSLAWSQDGSRLASASIDNTIKIWDPKTCQCDFTLEGHSDWVLWITWSEDGTRFASVSCDNTVRIWNPANGQCLLILEGHRELVISIAWSQDGSRLATGSNDHTIKIWDPTTGRCLSTLEGHISDICSIAWSQDGTRLVSVSSDKTVRIWDATTNQRASTLERHSAPVHFVSWLQDGSQVASVSFDRTIRIWDPTNSQCVSTLVGHSDRICSIAWSQDGSRLASASNDKTARIWDPTTGQCVSTLIGHRGMVRSIAWSQDGSRIASASNDKTARIWDPATGQCLSTLEGHSHLIDSIAWSQDGSRLASGSNDNTIKIWDPTNSQCVSTLMGHRDMVRSIAWSQDGSRIASASNDKTARIWDPATGQCLSTLEGHSHLIDSIAWSQDGSRLASGSNDNTIKIWDPTNSQCVSTLMGHRDMVRSIAWSQDGSRLASASNDKTARIWDPTTGQCASVAYIGSAGLIEFDKVNLNLIHTTSGTFNIEFSCPTMSIPHSFASSPRPYGYGLNDDHSWITYDGVNLLWLPVEYRPSRFSPSFALYATTFVIGCSSGRVIFLALPETSPLSGV
ncbi:hypothetical protein N7450_011552 [Penicillium hetheringtonii]|uniref:NACHT domain-containing protein n=1 Tax=Penicillium hetheringtonii TaxID=911720 RepID=A0AAD6DA62_9EURO|nr:hypothetical protein N7450_011552 [Penicillium hetheringtonii]